MLNISNIIQALACIFFLISIFKSIWIKSKSGALLSNLEMNDHHHLFSIATLSMSFLVVGVGAVSIVRQGSVSMISFSLIVMGIYFLYFGRNNPQIREKGILNHLRLTKWEELEYYTWQVIQITIKHH